MKIALLGYGKMGHAIEQIALQKGHQIVLSINDQNLDDLTKENIRRANNTNFGLAGAVWTSDVSRAHHIAREVKAGTFWINSYKTIHVAVPFGGFGDSGHGRSSGPGVLDEYTQTKAIWVPTRAADSPFPSLSY